MPLTPLPLTHLHTWGPLARSHSRRGERVHGCFLLLHITAKPPYLRHHLRYARFHAQYPPLYSLPLGLGLSD